MTASRRIHFRCAYIRWELPALPVIPQTLDAALQGVWAAIPDAQASGEDTTFKISAECACARRAASLTSGERPCYLGAPSAAHCTTVVPVEVTPPWKCGEDTLSLSYNALALCRHPSRASSNCSWKLSRISHLHGDDPLYLVAAISSFRRQN